MGKSVVFAFIACLMGMSCLAQNEQQRRPRFGFDATNPDVHDPVMARCDGKYYIFMTGQAVGSMTSDDMKSWTPGRGVMPEIPQWAMEAVPGYRGHTWAPDISEHNGTWYMYYSCSTFGKNGSAIGLMTNKTLNPESPDYKWEDKGMVVRSVQRQTNWNAIDPNLIMDEKGVVHEQSTKAQEVGKTIGLLSVLVGLLAKKPGVAGSGMVAAGRTTMRSNFSNVRKVKAVRRMNTIMVNERFSKNRVYVCDEDFDFVYDFISSRCRLE